MLQHQFSWKIYHCDVKVMILNFVNEQIIYCVQTSTEFHQEIPLINMNEKMPTSHFKILDTFFSREVTWRWNCRLRQRVSI